MHEQTERIPNPDILRILCILMVVKIHYNCSYFPSYTDALCRIAIPCFFLISGYFLAGKGPDYRHIIRSILTFVVVDCLYFALKHCLLNQSAAEILSGFNPVKSLLGWPCVWTPGWFLLSSAYAYIFIFLMDRFDIPQKIQLIIAFLLICILWYCQRNLSTAGIFGYLTFLRALPFFITGRFIRSHIHLLRSKSGLLYLCTLFISCIAVIAERYVFNLLHLPQPFFIYIGSITACVSLFMLFLVLPDLKSRTLAFTGAHICGTVYCVDEAVILIFRHLGLSPGYLIILLSSVLFSYIIYFVMKMIKYLFNRIFFGSGHARFWGLILVLILSVPFGTCRVKAADNSTTLSASYFKNRNITSVNIGADIENIEDDAFNNLHMLTKITVSAKNTRYASYDNCLYNKNKTKLICFPQGLAAAKIPNTVVEYSPYALKGKSAGIKKSIRDTINNNKNHSVTKSDAVGEGNDIYDISANIPNTELGFLVSDFIKSCYTKNMSSEALLGACYNQLINIASYKRFDSVYEGSWTKTYATDLLTSKRGNCSSYAATFAYLANAIGYESRVVTGVVGAKSGGSTPHAWTEIKIKDNWYIFDAEMEDANGKDYYCKTYENYPSSGLQKQKEWTLSW